MMKLYKKATFASAAIAMAATSVIASAAPAAQRLSVAGYVGARVGAEPAEESELRGGGFPVILLIAVVAVIIAAIAIAANGDDSRPTSP